MIINGCKHRSFKKAVEHAEKYQGRVAILVRKYYLTTTEAEAERIAKEGVSFAYLFIKDGKYLTVPVN